ncbi:amidase [Alcaligenes endophyticus]|uniref:Amidase n=1 Tax=Alcaligenes endophyticus TaxID=1929088 RepID=A0ABT8EKK7_9BURK|nr:amidase [Alcaligenes endophyticus]MCX5590813.1 amidase [Alcaligenes endophyticus]MDN4121824.1 amidase [Alcaligenes endophyticus]
MNRFGLDTHLGAWTAAKDIAAGRRTAKGLVEQCLETIARLNPDVHAFVAYDAQHALDYAAKIDAGAYAGQALRGIPFAVKDVIETAAYDTTYGSPIYAGHRPSVNAACVQRALDSGAVLMGKLATGEFATQTPSQARNPLRLNHTPGGSSSGSAAAVSAGMVPVAFGTQTTGSIVRPAVYCGVVGYKPSFGMLGSAGMKTLSHSQDTLGLITRDVRDAAFFSTGLLGAKMVEQATDAPHIAVCYSHQWDYVSEQGQAAIERLAQKIERCGGKVSHIHLPALLDELVLLQPRLFMFEALQNLAPEWHHHREQLSPRLQARLQQATTISLNEYLDIRQRVEQGKAVLAELLAHTDAILYPAAADEAPEGLQEAGDPRFGALWSMLHVPSVSFPVELGNKGLPLGAQLIGRFAQDLRLLSVSRWLEDEVLNIL